MKVYAVSKWNESTVNPPRNFTQKEQDAISRAVVVDSPYGMSACFFLKAGGQSYIPLDASSSASAGDSVDMSKAILVTLEKEGEDDIYRIRV